MPNAITNIQISNQAIVLGNGLSRLDLNLSVIKNHHGGLLGAKTLQSYGCNALYRDFAPDFLIAVGNNGIIDEIAASDYTADNIVYTNSIHTLEHPGKFYLIPHDPYADAGTTAAYIPAFDGHKNIYLLGFDGQDTPGHNYNVYAGTPGYEDIKVEGRTYTWRQNFRQLAQVYNDVMFSFVFKESTRVLPVEFRDLLNVEIINYNKFVIAVDL